MPQPSAIPVGTQFTPKLISLPDFLGAIVTNSGDKPAMTEAVWKRPVNIRPEITEPTTRQASLPLEAAVQYGLLTPGTYEATAKACELNALTTNELFDAFAAHILVNLGCIRVVEAVQQMELDGARVTADSLARYLSAQGYPVVEHNTAINSLRMWLAEAGVFSAQGWSVNAATKARIIGLTDDDVAAIIDLTDFQRAFLRSLCVLDPQGEIDAATVRRHAEMMSGTTLPRSSARVNFLQPLEAAGLIEFRTGGISGGSSAVLNTTPKFRADVLEPFLDHAVSSLDSALTAYYRKPPSEIYEVLQNPDTTPNERGTALEAFVIHVMRTMGLRFVGWRARPRDLGYSEVDAVLAGLIGGIATRWQVQCKNTGSQASADIVQREVGLLPLTKATHLMMVCTAGFSGPARRYTHQVMRESATSIYLLGREEFERIKSNPASIADIVREQSEVIAAIPRTGLDWTP